MSKAKGLTFAEAIERIAKGAKVKRAGDDYPIYADPHTFNLIADDYGDLELTVEDVTATDWEVAT